MVVGWYHSHPGFGCWLSGTDINTQQVLYKVEEHDSSFYRTRKWVLNRSKIALI